MEVRYRYRLKPEFEKEIKEARLKEWEKFIRFCPDLSSEDKERLKEILLNKLPGVDPKPLIEEAKKLKHEGLKEDIICLLEDYYYKSDIPVPNELVEGASDFEIYLP